MTADRETRTSWRGRAAVWTLTLCVSGCGGPDTLITGDTAFVDVRVIPMDRERMLDEQTVVVDDGRIVAMGPSSEIGPADGVEVIDGDGRYLIPGLTEMHGHLPSPRMADEDARNVLFLYVANGVTTVRGMQGHPSQFDIRDEIDRGLMVGPRLYLGSAAMSGANVETPERAEQLVREYKVRGYDLIKTLEGLTLETYDALARTADAVGIPFGGHVPDAVGLRHALAAGQVSIDHLDNYIEALVPEAERSETPPGLFGLGDILDRVDESRLPELVQATVEAGAWVVPTMVLWETAFFTDRPAATALLQRPEVRHMPPEMVAGWTRAIDQRLEASEPRLNRRVAELRRRILQALYRGGANIASGTDSPQILSVPGFAMHHEMQVYHEIGMTAYDILAIATRKPAEYFAATDEFGVVDVGRVADLVLLDDNPLEDIGNLAEPAGVMRNGRWFSAIAIRERLDEIARFYGNE